MVISHLLNCIMANAILWGDNVLYLNCVFNFKSRLNESFDKTWNKGSSDCFWKVVVVNYILDKVVVIVVSYKNKVAFLITEFQTANLKTFSVVPSPEYLPFSIVYSSVIYIFPMIISCNMMNEIKNCCKELNPKRHLVAYYLFEGETIA